MSITFSVSMAPVTCYQLHDLLGGRGVEVYPTYARAEAALRALHASGQALPGSSDPEAAIHHGSMIDVLTEDEGRDPALRVNGASAAHLLEVLGYSSKSLSGTKLARDFLERVVQAQDVGRVDGEARPVVSSAGVTEGRRHGSYVTEALRELERIATWAAERNRTVGWG
ncbi:MAG: hypothetical protein WA988_07625 [Candidatus Nanopelagicales bacterium]